MKSETRNSKEFNLETRTLLFARNIMNYVKNLPRNIPNLEIGKQLVRSGGSIGANYLEANDSFSKKDFIFRCRIAKKEAKESIYWLELSEPNPQSEETKKYLMKEANELMNILGAIIQKVIINHQEKWG